MEALHYYAKKHDVDRYWTDLFKHIKRLDHATIRARLQETVLNVALQPATITDRADVAVFLGANPAADWIITEEYLKKKTKAEIITLGHDLGVFEDPKARAYYDENIGKAIENCKKTELIDIFIKSGVDLAGRIPAEILKTEN